MTETPLDFEKVELVREKLGLSVRDMAALIGTTHVTYYKWTQGGPVRKANADKVKSTLRTILVLLKSGEWPTQEAHRMSSKERLATILEILAQSE